MKSNLILILSLLLIIANSKVLKQEQHDGQVQIFMEMEKDEEVIDFQQDFQSDQITCRLSDCLCYFTKENEDQINNIECEGHFMSFFRTNRSRRITAETYTDSDMPNSLTVSTSLTLKWKFNNDGTIEFATIWKKLSWLGIGFGSNMKNVDMIAINVSGQTVSLIDLYSTSDTTPSTDSSQDLTLISYTVGTSSVSTRFSRKLSTGDTKDKTLTVGSTYSWCYAYSSALQMERHSNTGGFSFTLSNSSTATNSTSNSTSTDSDSNESEGSESESDDSDSDSDSKKTGSTSDQIILLLKLVPLFFII